MSFDIIGSKEKAVAIVEIEESEDEKKIAEEIMKKHKNVKSVLKKVSARKGELRLREYELIAGEKNTEVVHKEYGYSLKLDPQKVYFSPREAEERQRIAEQAKPGERILVMFSGIAPIAIAIAKKQPEVEKIYCIEKNEEAHKYAEENVRRNKLSHKILLIHGDAEEEAKKLGIKFDRIVMPLPFGAKNFLDVALSCLKDNGIIHFYSVEDEGCYSKVLDEIETFAKKFGKSIKVLNIKKVSAYAPRKWKVCVDFQVS
ncbi:MAG: class I SAM-dependent methyltransferase family protein [Candidatus Aenigmatarchaeota archaeon]